MSFYNERTGERQSNGGTLYDAHIKPTRPTQAETNVQTFVAFTVALLIISWWVRLSWNWSRWVVRHSSAWATATFLFLFNMIYPMWIIGIFGNSPPAGSKIYLFTFNDERIIVSLLGFYIIVIAIVFWLTICRYLALPKSKKIEIAKKNREDRENAK